MTDKCIAEFSAVGKRVQLIEHDDGRGGYTIFTRFLDNWDLDDVDCYNQKESAFARFLLVINRIMLGIL